jgi:hypothetical protein
VAHETTKQLIENIIDANTVAFEEGLKVGYREGWAACEAKYRRERDELGRRLAEAGSGVCEEARAK